MDTLFLLFIKAETFVFNPFEFQRERLFWRGVGPHLQLSIDMGSFYQQLHMVRLTDTLAHNKKTLNPLLIQGIIMLFIFD